MPTWKLAPIIALSALAVPIEAQDSSFPMPDYSATIGDAAQGAATMAAARGATGSRPVSRPSARSTSSGQPSARTRRNCARARGFEADRVKHPQLPRVLAMCRQLGL